MTMTNEERNVLITNYLPLANKLAWKKNKSTPNCVNIDELKSAAYMGLVDAAKKFKPTQGSFGSYAAIRIIGEIKDYLRQLGRFPEVSLDIKANEDQMTLVDSIPAFESKDPTDFFEEVTKNLNTIGKKVVKSYYIDDQSLKEIGVSIQVSESRVSQIFKKCRESLKTTWKDYELREAI